MLQSRLAKDLRGSWLRDGARTSPMTSISRLSHYTTAMTRVDSGAERFEWLNHKGDSFLSFDGNTIDARNIGTMYQALFDEAESLLHEITQGIDTDLSEDFLTFLQDSLNTSATEYSFLGDHNDHMRELRHRFLLWSVRQGGYANGTLDGRPAWNRAKMESLFHKCHRLNELFMVLMYVLTLLSC